MVAQEIASTEGPISPGASPVLLLVESPEVPEISTTTATIIPKAPRVSSGRERTQVGFGLSTSTGRSPRGRPIRNVNAPSPSPKQLMSPTPSTVRTPRTPRTPGSGIRQPRAGRSPLTPGKVQGKTPGSHGKREAQANCIQQSRRDLDDRSKLSDAAQSPLSPSVQTNQVNTSM